MGTSAGAVIALDLAVRCPDLVRAVVAHEAPRHALRHPSPSALGTLVRMQWLGWRGRDAFPEDWRRIARENGISVLADLRMSIGGYPRADDLATIASPVVCTYGSRSGSYMRAITHSLARAIPTASVREIEGAAHAVTFDAPDSFVHVIIDAIR